MKHTRRTAPIVLLVLMFSTAVARAQGQVTYTAGNTLWRVAAQSGAAPQNVSARLDAIAQFPGGHVGPIAVSADGAWYVFRSERFAADSQGFAGLTVAPATLTSAETIAVNGASLHGEGLAAITSGGTAVVFEDGGSPHTRDLYVVRRQGSGWTAPQLLTGASPFTYNYWPSLSADGTKVAFNMGPSSFPSTAIGEVRLDGTGFRTLITKDDGPAGSTAGSRAEAHSPAYAPDGSVVFEAQWSSDPSLSQGVERLWRLPAAGGTPALLPGTINNDNSPVVLPDGRIVSLALPVSNHQIKVMDASGQNSFFLTPASLDVADIGLGAGGNLPGTVTPTPTPSAGPTPTPQPGPTPTPTPAAGLTISGRVTNAAGTGLANVRLTRTGSATAVTTAANGNFSFPSVPAGTYTLSAALSGFVFNPPTAVVTVRAANVTDVLYIGVQAPYIIGRVATATGAGVAGVSILRINRAGIPTATRTNAGGYYGFSSVPPGTYEVTAGRPQTTFVPPAVSVTISSTLRAATANFTALTAPSISGRAYTSHDAGLSGVIVTRRNSTGAVATATTDANGYYSFSFVAPGTYTLSARRVGFTFVPTARAVTVTAATGAISVYFLGTPSATALAASTATASVATNSIHLVFATTLDAESASNPDSYRVTVNGAPVVVDAAGYDEVTKSLTLSLPPGTLRAGDPVTISFNFNDLAGNSRTGRAGPLTAR